LKVVGGVSVGGTLAQAGIMAATGNPVGAALFLAEDAVYSIITGPFRPAAKLGGAQVYQLYRVHKASIKKL
jgi:hypothetical protein